MKPRWLDRRLPVRGDESGVALIYALLFTTVIAIVIAAVIGLADANLRATVALREQAAEAAAADGAAKVAINTLRLDDYNGTSGQCLGGVLQLPAFYQSGGETVSTRVECTYDDGASQHPGSTGAGFALLTLPVGTQQGLAMKTNGSGEMQVYGDVGSTGKAHVDAGTLRVFGDFSSGSCEIDNGGHIIDFNGTIQYPLPNPPPARCTDPADGDPLYELPLGARPDTPGSASACVGGVQTFSPGLYTNVTPFNSNCGVKYFPPGIYWFGFNGEWVTKNSKVVAGAVSSPGSNPTMATACSSPFDPNHDPDAGAMFVFGGNARWKLDNGGKAAVCAPLSQVQDQPPIAMFGLTQPVTGNAGTLSPPAPTSCIRGDKDANGANSKCATFQTLQFQDIELYLNGATYLPNGWLDLNVRGSVQQFITGGLVVRQFQIFVPASGVLPKPLSSGPLPGGPGGARTVVYLSVYVCPGSGTCTTGGSLRLKAKVAVHDPRGAPEDGGYRPITVLSWSVQR